MTPRFVPGFAQSLRRWRLAIDHLVDRFVTLRTPVDRRIVLRQSRIYILPSRYGTVLLLLVLALFLGGVNYANTIILSLAYLMISFFMVSMVHTFRNLNGLILEASHAHNGFAGDTVMFEISVSRSGARRYEAITLYWDHGAASTVHLVERNQEAVSLRIPVAQRGLFKPGRLRIESRFPVGLFFCWSYARFDLEAWVYPKPIKNTTLLQAPYRDGHDAVGALNGTDDFAELRRYTPGDPIRHLDWKAYARGGELLTKTFVDPVDQDFWIDWQAFSEMEREMAFGHICYWVLKLTEQHRYFGLRLPHIEVELGRGEHHKVRCLEALAQA